MKLTATIMIASAILMLSSCHSHKDKDKSNKDKYRNEYSDDIYRRGSYNNSGDRKESALYREAMSWLGVPYKYGGHSRRGTDCSGLVMEVYKIVYNKAIMHNSADICSKQCRRIKESELREGDLVFFTFVKSGKISHVGIYLRKRQFIHASSSRGVIINSLDEPYYAKGFVAAGRLK